MTTTDDFERDPVAALRETAPWLLEPAVGTCVVGSHALAIACARAGIAAPRARDLDLAWALDTDAGRRLLEQHGAFVPTTTGNVERGTLAGRFGGRRVEITTFRGSDDTASLAERIERDLRARDMTTGALAVELESGDVHDPTGGLDDFRARRIAPVGDPADRIREHPVRWLRYYRKAREWDFDIDRSIRNLDLPANVLDRVPREALAAELRAALLQCRSPGRFLVDLHEASLLAHIAPELDLQFDGRPAGPQRWHPEIGQALHMVLALEWAAGASTGLDDRDRLAVMVAVLCHDLGKGYTPTAEWPRHLGHEGRGLEPLDRLLQRFPGLADQRTRSLARSVCELHATVRDLPALRPGTLAELYDRHFRADDPPIELFALAVAADSAGRLGTAAEGQPLRAQLLTQLRWLRACCSRVDAAELRRRHADVTEFRRALHEERTRELKRGRHEMPGG